MIACIFLSPETFPWGRVCTVTPALYVHFAILFAVELACGDGAPTKRRSCGYDGVSAKDCRAIGCCWDTTIEGVSWCFHPENQTGKALSPLLRFLA